ncbi:MAG: IS1634 family transposase [bacterium]|nr:IS1634 family transposase [bacterium]
MLTKEQVQSRKEWQILSERVDDIPLLIGMMKRMELPRVLDRYTPTHWNQRELSWGWTTTIWLAYIVSEGDHRKVAVKEYVKSLPVTLGQLTGQTLSEEDFDDDRLSVVLKYLSDARYWHPIEEELSRRTIRVYDLETEVIRCDATTGSGYHAVTEGGLFQFGHSKDDPSLAQIKLMSGALDPLGMPLATDVVSGEQADDGLYWPLIARMQRLLKRQSVLYVGDCKMSAWETRARIASVQSHYLCPLPRTGTTPELLEQWVQAALVLAERDALEEVRLLTADGEEGLVAVGHGLVRQQSGECDGQPQEWTERVLVVKSFAHAEAQKRGLEARLDKAEEQLFALTPPRGRGKRQIEDETTLLARIEKILQTQQIEGFFTVRYERQVERRVKQVGRGRGGPNRRQEVVERVRYQITSISWDEVAIEAARERCGWRAYVTNAPLERLALADAVKLYRQECRIERVFDRLKNRLSLSPMFVQEPKQVTGLTHLLMLGVRLLSLIEYVVRRSLVKDQQPLAGLNPDRPKKVSARPTAERLLQAFRGLTLTVIHMKERVVRHLTPLSALQEDILKRLGLDATLYHHLEIHKTSFG